MRKLKASNTARAIVLAVAVIPLAGIAYAGGMGGHGGYAGGQCDHDGARHEGRHGGHHGARHDGRMGHRGAKDIDRHVDGRMAFLKAEIAITPAQETEWQAVEDVLRAGIEKRVEHAGERREQRGEAAQHSAPERLDGHIAAMEAHLAHMKAMEGALTDLYTVLDETQKASANELLPGAGRGHRFMGRFMHRG